jgi:hypothetical protein
MAQIDDSPRGINLRGDAEKDDEKISQSKASLSG